MWENNQHAVGSVFFCISLNIPCIEDIQNDILLYIYFHVNIHEINTLWDGYECVSYHNYFHIFYCLSYKRDFGYI